MKENIKLGIVLLLITGIAGFVLGKAHDITAAPIAEQAIKTNNEAMQEILPEASEFEKVDKTFGEESVIREINKGLKGSDLTGYAIKVTPKGYGGKIEMMVGISKDGKVSGMKILSHSETPGLGANAPNPKFSGQFKGKPIEKDLEVVKRAPSADNEIQALTGATITSRGVTGGVNEAIKYYNSELKGGQE